MVEQKPTAISFGYRSNEIGIIVYLFANKL